MSDKSIGLYFYDDRGELPDTMRMEAGDPDAAVGERTYVAVDALNSILKDVEAHVDDRFELLDGVYTVTEAFGNEVRRRLAIASSEDGQS